MFGWGQLLRTRGLRQLANRMAYHDKDRLATEDAMRIGRLHTHCPGGQLAHAPCTTLGSARETELHQSICDA